MRPITHIYDWGNRDFSSMIPLSYCTLTRDLCSNKAPPHREVPDLAGRKMHSGYRNTVCAPTAHVRFSVAAMVEKHGLATEYVAIEQLSMYPDKLLLDVFVIGQEAT